MKLHSSWGREVLREEWRGLVEELDDISVAYRVD